MADNAWTDHEVDVGPFGGNLVVKAIFPASTTTVNANGFKFRSTQSFTLAAQVLAFEATMRSPQGDQKIIYPKFPALSDSTYDGTWQFFFEVPEALRLSEIVIWDGDMDRGSDRDNPDNTDRDTDDPDTAPGDRPAGLPVQSMADAYAEGIATDNSGPEGCSTNRLGVGNPPDDTTKPAGNAFLREPNVRFTILDPDGNVVFVNDNPSGNREWEKTTIRLNSHPDGCTADNADVCVDVIPAGT